MTLTLEASYERCRQLNKRHGTTYYWSTFVLPKIKRHHVHALYGFSAIIAVGILYSYRTSSFMKGKELLLYGAGCLFIMGLGLRNLAL